ncbi:hypothetical protein BHE74_00012491 [Ensete ventricosum]|nr:hypothetical protein BHE74_00012491 [Ensete ventricosum]
MRTRNGPLIEACVWPPQSMHRRCSSKVRVQRKVLKALSIKGVLRADVHPTLPKVTVVGDVDVRILIKKLSKVGKSAEVLPDKTQKPQGEEKRSEEAGKKSETSSKKEEDKEGSGSEKPNPEEEESKSKSSANGSGSNKTQGREKVAGDDGAKTTAAPEAAKSLNPTTVTTLPPVSFMMNPRMAQAPVYYYPVEPIALPMPYYAMTACPPPAPLQSQATAFGDYFNEDNTVGCRIM